MLINKVDITATGSASSGTGAIIGILVLAADTGISSPCYDTIRNCTITATTTGAATGSGGRCIQSNQIGSSVLNISDCNLLSTATANTSQGYYGLYMAGASGSTATAHLKRCIVKGRGSDRKGVAYISGISRANRSVPRLCGRNDKCW